MSARSPISESDLHAYADGLLPAERLAEVADYLQQQPGQLERLRVYRQQNQSLHLLYDDVLDEPLPPRFAAFLNTQAGASETARPQEKRRMPLLRWAAMLLLTVAGAVGGWVLHGAAQNSSVPWLAQSARSGVIRAAQTAPLELARQAAVAHAVYSPDVRRPVEIGADQEQALVTWLSKRIGSPIRAPKLATLGFELIGGRLLPGQSGPVAQFMYQDRGGQRLTLYVSRDQQQNQDTGFRFAEEGKINVFYWIDGEFGYALSGGISRADLSRIASAVYEQLELPAAAGTAKK
jgi:anti-sigma factor RsiW